MIINGKAYRAKNASAAAVADTETADYSVAVAEAVSNVLGVTKRKSIPVLLYQGDQFQRGDIVARHALDRALAGFSAL
jgi:hypothetical protein